MVRDTLARQRPQAIDKFLRGCLQAERYVAEQPERSMAIVARRLKMEIDPMIPETNTHYGSADASKSSTQIRSSVFVYFNVDAAPNKSN